MWTSCTLGMYHVYYGGIVVCTCCLKAIFTAYSHLYLFLIASPVCICPCLTAVYPTSLVSTLWMIGWTLLRWASTKTTSPMATSPASTLFPRWLWSKCFTHDREQFGKQPCFDHWVSRTSRGSLTLRLSVPRFALYCPKFICQFIRAARYGIKYNIL